MRYRLGGISRICNSIKTARTKKEAASFLAAKVTVSIEETRVRTLPNDYARIDEGPSLQGQQFASKGGHEQAAFQAFFFNFFAIVI